MIPEAHAHTLELPFNDSEALNDAFDAPEGPAIGLADMARFVNAGGRLKLAGSEEFITRPDALPTAPTIRVMVWSAPLGMFMLFANGTS
jgi:hypothetical protein